MVNVGILYFDKEEIIQIAISVIAISFAFSIAFAGTDALINQPNEFLAFCILAFVTVGSGFILHEMGHKLVAIYYGAKAAFRMWMNGLLVIIFGSLFVVLFAAPLAVYIHANKIEEKEN